MNITSTPQTSFGAKFYIPGKNNTTLRFNTTGDILDLKSINYDVLQKGKVLESKNYHNKKGFDIHRMAVIYEEVQKKVKEGYDFLDEMFNAHFNDNI